MANEAERAQFGSSLEFILTVIGYAVGLGNVWRFPYLVFKHGGAPFLIPFFAMLFLVGIPTFFLETAIGQFSGLSPSHAFEKMSPVFQGVGYAAIIINAFVGFYYNVIIAYCLYYLVFSLRSELLWSNCNGEIDCFKRLNLSSNCTEDKLPFVQNNITIRSPSEVYFYDKVLEISDGIQNLDGLVTPLVLALLLAWFLVYVALAKGVASLGKISYFTSTFPYVMLTILVVRGALLEGAGEGVKFYVGQFNISQLGDPELWKDATVQVFYALSACTGGLISMSSFNAFNNNLLRDALLVPILDCLTGFYAGFAIFTVLGHMYITKCVDSFNEVAAKGPELAFVVYPEGLSLMGKAAPFFSFLFFIMMLALGFGSEFSIMESVMSTAIDIFNKKINTRAKQLGARLVICIVYFLCGLTMVSRGGLYVLNLIDTVIAGYPLLIVGLLQVIVVPWVYGTERFVNDIECMIGKKSKSFWLIWIISWRFITPLVLLGIIIATIIMPAEAISLKGVIYPDYAVAIGWVIVAIPIAAIPVCAIYQAYKFRANPRDMFKPSEDYYANRKKNEEKLKKADKSDNHFEMLPTNEANSHSNIRKNVIAPV
ncbi:unnamed protein product [Brachionus calyciflorus]|uniref:Transporter n=1 Tax=Brachionus calyciflorus TaxID=104777 RepID=A0A813V9Q3_9BILA|nr:unnamed protein product [Brachionus calyciflorus]